VKSEIGMLESWVTMLPIALKSKSFVHDRKKKFVSFIFVRSAF
jgi:hypothetical protein